MSASQEDLKLMFQEAESRGDRDTAVAVMSKLESFEAPTETQQEGIEFGERLEKKLGVRLEEVNKTLEDHATGEIGTGTAGLQLVGKGVAGSAFDILGEETVEAVKGISLLIPDSIEDPVKEAVKEGWDWLSKTDPGDFIIDEIGGAIKGGMKVYNAFKEANPQEAKTLESVVNIGMLMAPAKTKANAKPTILGRPAAALEKSAEKSILKRRMDFIGDLITPKKTSKVLTEEVARTTEKGVGPFKRNIVQLSQREADVAAEVSKISGVTPKNTVQRNYNIISRKNAKIAEKLKADLGKRKILILKNKVSDDIDNAATKLVSENPVIVGDAQKVAERVAVKAKELINSNSSTAEGLLEARKQLDAWIRRQKGQKAFDPSMENALSTSVRTVRQSMNESLNKAVPSAAVKSQLKKQNLLYDALDNMAPKAAAEANTAIARVWQNAVKVLPFRGVANQELALLFGVGGLGAAAMFAPYVSGLLGLTLTGMGIKKAIISPKTRAGLGKLLKMADEALLSSKNPSMIKQLRADRALVVELLKNSEIQEEEE